MTADQVAALALRVGTLARDADLGGQLTDDEQDAWGFARTVVAAARDAGAGDPTVERVAGVLGGLVLIGEAIHRLVVLGRKIDVKAKAMALSVSGLGDGVEVYSLD